jgi:UDP-glucose 4-epimerase
LPALKEGDMTRRCPDNAVMRKLLNRRMTTLEEGIIKLIDSRKLITA